MRHYPKSTQSKSSTRYGTYEEHATSICKNDQSSLFDNWSIKSIQTQLMFNPLYLKAPLNSAQVEERNKAIKEFIYETEILMAKLNTLVEQSIKHSSKLHTLNRCKIIKHAEPMTASMGSQASLGCTCWPGLLCR